MKSSFPKLSFGLPVYNAEDTIDKAVNSVLKQTFTDFELIICDNASTDRTVNICRNWAHRDNRVRLHSNSINIGLLPNFNRAFQLARGEFFRWMGSDDWLETEYASACVSALDANPNAIGVSTYQAYWQDGVRYYREYQGPRVDDPSPHKRFSRMLWLSLQSFLLVDPMYYMYRRKILSQTRLNRIMVASDIMLCAELSLLGPYRHVPRQLSNRRRVLVKSLLVHPPPGHPDLKFSAWEMFQTLVSIIRDAGLTGYPRIHAVVSAFKYCFKRKLKQIRGAVNAFRRRMGIRRPSWLQRV